MSRGRSFGLVADTYDRVRPTYPEASLSWALGAGPLDVIDVGAGTGKLTDVALRLGHRVTAVEPDDNMRAYFVAGHPSCRALRGTGESVPVASGSADAVIVGQAFHWMRPCEAMAEFRRMLRPRGVVALLWNERDHDEPWARRFSAALEGAGNTAAAMHDAASGAERYDGFTDVETHEQRWTVPMDVESLVALAASRSYVIALSDGERDARLDAVRATCEAESAAAGGSQLALPYITRTFRYTRA